MRKHNLEGSLSWERFKVFKGFIKEQYLCSVLSCDSGAALVANDEGSANPTTVTGNVDTVMLSVDTDELSYPACPPQLPDGEDKLHGSSVYAKNLAIQEDNAYPPARLTQDEPVGILCCSQTQL